MSQYHHSVKMWNESSCANRNGCHSVACCSLLRRNNKMRVGSICESWRGGGWIQDKNGKCGQLSDQNPRPGFWVIHCIFNIPVRTDHMSVICWCSFNLRMWVNSATREAHWEAPVWFLLVISHNDKVMRLRSSQWSLPHIPTPHIKHLFSCWFFFFPSTAIDHVVGY